MSIRQSPLWKSYQSDSESSYYIGSYNSSTESDSDIPGPGRLLGKVYNILGKKAEICISEAAVRLGRGPRATAMKIRRLAREGSLLKPHHGKELKKAGRRLVRYVG